MIGVGVESVMHSVVRTNVDMLLDPVGQNLSSGLGGRLEGLQRGEPDKF